ncbi:hypothetical protein IWQ60_002587 [Tieghemiomyces parasiticus]|uniref:Peroxisomal membrane protein PMP22 n=1 Tax=Tieghemiomyces parasiticus TaxID=78921 RepID=A0A9W8E0U4_9FUNG|nr:hypothetical protein IWQ60_002587 [Tieghemiomyces parasiticus]
MAVLSKSILTQMLTFYLTNLMRRPLLTKACTAGALLGLQEQLAKVLAGTAQRGGATDKAAETEAVEANAICSGDGPHTALAKIARRHIDPKVVQMALYGFFLSGPLGHYLYETLGRFLAKRKGPIVPVLMLLISNLVFSPIQNAVYLMAMAFIAGKRKPAQLAAVVKDQLLRLQKVSWVLFPAVQLFANRFIPQPLWVPFFNLIGFVFGVYVNTQAKRTMLKKP